MRYYVIMKLREITVYTILSVWWLTYPLKDMKVNGKDDIPYMKWKINFMFQTTNQLWYNFWPSPPMFLAFFSTARWIPIFVHPCPREKGRALKAAWRRAWLGSTLWSKKLGDQHDLKEHAAHVGIIHFRLWGYRNNMKYLGFTNICFAEFFWNMLMNHEICRYINCITL